MFDICFLSRKPEVQAGGWPALSGRITLGSYAERFLAPVDRWTPEDYEHQWREAAARLLAGRPTAFWTVPWQFWWVMWPLGGEAVVQEQFLTPDRLAGMSGPLGPLVGSAPYELVGPRETRTTEGQAVSEWRLLIADVGRWYAGQPPKPSNA